MPVHRHSATSLVMSVSRPVPRSVPPLNSMNVPSPSRFTVAFEESRPGSPEPCWMIARPLPIRTSGSSLAAFVPHSIIPAPCSSAGPRPQLDTACGVPSRPSPRQRRISSVTPSRTRFFSRNARWSMPSFSAISAHASWSAYEPCGAP